jgi:hypothetical protein
MLALGMSAYLTYSIRREVSRGLAEIAPLQTLITYTFKRTGEPPASEHDVPGLAVGLGSNPVISAVTIDHGRIEIRFGDEANPSLRGRVLHVTPFETADGKIVWLCADDPPDVGLYPLGLLNGANVAMRTAMTVEQRYLPVSCR